MQNFTLETHVGADGILHLNLPVMMKNMDLAVTVVCRPLVGAPKKPRTTTVWQALQAFRARAHLTALDIDTGLFDGDRKQQKERDIDL